MTDMQEKLPEKENEENLNKKEVAENETPQSTETSKAVKDNMDLTERDELNSAIASRTEEQKSEELKTDTEHHGTPENNSDDLSDPNAKIEEQKVVSPAKAEVKRKEDLAEMSDEDLEKDDEDEEVSSDEDEQDEHSDQELTMIDYSEYTPEQLVAEAEKLLKNEPVHKLKTHFDDIRKHLLSQLNEEKKEKLQEFIEAGGVEMDFEYNQPLRDKFKKIFSEYRSKRQAYYRELDERLQNNLRKKNELIEQIKELVSKDESIGETFKEFNAIQNEWRNTGPVPRNESADLWRNYHHHVENFYEYIKINKELRDLDFKKNHELKENLIKKAEELNNDNDVPRAFSQLQKLHKEWKRIGPVEREQREPMWERFSEITKALHDKREAYFNELKGKREELIQKKRSLVEQLEEFPFDKIKNHRQWQEAIKAVEAMREQFRKIGRVDHPENDTIWDKFRAILKDFNHMKNSFYKEMKKEQYDNLNKKKELLQIAEALKESTDWKNATNELKRIQAEWKRIGHVPRTESDKIWKKFRAACNHYFDRLTSHNKNVDAQFEDNYTAKNQLLEELKAFEPAETQKDSIRWLKDIINKWKEIGKVPRNKTHIDEAFNRELDKKFKSIDLDRQEAKRIRFENRISHLVSDDGDDYNLRKERDVLRNKLDEAKKELGQLENNMGFFSSSNSKSPFMVEAQKKIDQQKHQLADLEEQIKMLNIKIREIKNAGNETETE